MSLTDTLSSVQRPLTPQQQSRQTNAQTLTHHQWVLSVDANLQPEDIEAALQRLQQHHDIFRTHWVELPGYRLPRQQVQTRAAGWISRLDTQAPFCFALAPIDGDAKQRTLTLWLAAHLMDASSGLLVIDALQHLLAQPELTDSSATAIPTLDEAVLQYSEYTDWLLETRQDGERDAALDYWAPFNDLPSWQPFLQHTIPEQKTVPQQKTADHSVQAKQQACIASAGQAMTDLTPVAQTLQTSVSTLLQALWWALLWRHQGETAFRGDLLSDVRYATHPSDHTNHDEESDSDAFNGALGCLAHTLPLNINPASNTTLAQFIRQLDAQAQAHTDWQEYWPITDQPTRPQITYEWLSMDALTAKSSKSPSCRHLHIHSAQLVSSAQQIALQAQQFNGRVGFHVRFDTEVLSEGAAQTLLQQFEYLLQTVVSTPSLAQQPLKTLALHSQASADNLLLAYQATRSWETPYLPERIAEHATTRGQHLALVSDRDSVSYQALQQRVSHLAGHLQRYLQQQHLQQNPQQHGTDTGARVALLLPAGTDAVVAILACWACGAAYVPLDCHWPEQRLLTLLAQADVSVLISVSDQHRDLTIPNIERIDLDTLPKPVKEASGDGHCPSFQRRAEDLAYVLFTSGSTGLPKGVMVTHGALHNYTLGVVEALSLDRCERFSVASSLATDLGLTQVFSSLMLGKTLVLPTEATVRDSKDFGRFMTQHKVDCLKIVPSHLRALMSHHANAVLPLQQLILGGEATDAALAQQIAQTAPTLRIANHYGPTEATVGVLVQTFDTQRLPSSKPLTLNRVLPNNQVAILNSAQHIQAVGIPGELVIAGDNLSQGYFNRPDEQARYFKNSVLPDHFGARMYFTGDRAVYLPDGTLRLLGRADDQVSIRGYRIELSEIEAQLTAMNTVAEAVVILNPTQNEAQLLAFVTSAHTDNTPLSGNPANNPTETAAQLMAQLRAQLPEPMVPQALHVMPQIPRLANGKVDRSSLRSLVQPSSEACQQAPETAMEHILHSIWQDVMASENPIGVTEDFFALGGHSLMAITLSSRIQRLLNTELPPGVIFECPTIRRLAQRLEQSPSTQQRAEQLMRLYRQQEQQKQQQPNATEGANRSNSPKTASAVHVD